MAGSERGDLGGAQDRHAARGAAGAGHGDALFEDGGGVRGRLHAVGAQGVDLRAEGVEPQVGLLQLRAQHVRGAARCLIRVVGQAKAEGVQGVGLGERPARVGVADGLDVVGGQAEGLAVGVVCQIGQKVVAQLGLLVGHLQREGHALQHRAHE